MLDATAIANAKATLASINDLASRRAFINTFGALAEAGKTAILYSGNVTVAPCVICNMAQVLSAAGFTAAAR